MFSNSASAIQNRLLLGLSSEQLGELLPHLRETQLELKQVLYLSGDRFEYAYFVQAGQVSLIMDLEDGSSVEVGTTGREGMVSVSLLNGSEIATLEAVVQAPGSALRLPAGILLGLLDREPSVRRHLTRYAESFQFQVARTAACNATHTLEERLARWLLLVRHRIDSDELPLTHEFLSMMLAVRRAGVTMAARSFQGAGLIKYRHGHITVLDPNGLEEVSCECYRAILQEETRLLTN
jgi:CRP-like cAMP-binding protein